MFSYKKNNIIPRILTKERRKDNNKVILFTNARDEPNIAEWIAHHILIGFDKIFIFDHKSRVPIRESLNTNFGGILSIKKVEGTGNIKLKLMEDAVNIALKENYSWMLYLDADEFINLNGFNNIKDFLNGFSEADAIGINWLMYGTSGHVKQPKGLLTENFVRSEMRLNSHVKSFVRPTVVVRVENPHYFIITNKSRYYSGNGTRMPRGPFNNQPLPFINSRIYIAHYYTQSEEEHFRRKSRIMDDGTTNKSSGLKDVHSVYNNVVNNQLQNKYSQNIKNFLLTYGIEI